MATIIIFTDSENRLNRLINSTNNPVLNTNELMSKDYPSITEYCEINKSELPTLFKGAWVKEGQAVIVEMEKARDLHMNEIRSIRNQELAKKDKEIYLAEDKSDSNLITTLRNERQILRDIPQTFDLSAAQTPEELYALWPSELPERV